MPVTGFVGARATSSATVLPAGPTPVPVIFPVESYDEGTGYDQLSGLYTCPIDGLYQVNVSFDGTVPVSFFLFKNNIQVSPDPVTDFDMSDTVKCLAGDTLQIKAFGPSTISGTGANYVSFTLVGTVDTRAESVVYGEIGTGGPRPATGAGIELVLPPNKRTQVLGSEYIVYPTHSKYNKADSNILAGEDLWIAVNKLIQTSNVDYAETFEGPKAKIRLISSFPPNSLFRFRMLSAFGSALAAKANDITLQMAYNGGQIVNEVTGIPIQFNSNVVLGETALKLGGSLEINGGPSNLGGIFGPIDQSFVIGREDNKPKEVWTALSVVKSHLSHPGSALKIKTAAQTVTGTGPTVITGATLTLDDNMAYRVKVKATARRSDGTLGNASFTMEGTFYRDMSGAAQASGYPMTRINGAEGDGLDYAIMFATSGNDIETVVYGTSGSVVQWAITVEWQAVGLAS